MGMLVNGIWQEEAEIAHIEQGHFVRPEAAFRHWITADGSSEFTAEPNRYHLYISYACPWACRTLIMRKLKGLDEVISFSITDPIMGEKGWSFGKSGKHTADPINAARYLYEIYTFADMNYTGKVTVPVLWDKKSKAIVSNESSEIMRMLNSEFRKYCRTDYDYYPENLHKEINEVNQFVYENINNGVYKCGFAKTQKAYEEAFDKLFSALEKVEATLGNQRFLLGDKITEADWRLFTTLVRFDVVYVGHFKCNLKRINDYPQLSSYLRDLYQMPGIKETVQFTHIKEHYYASHIMINPNKIVPKGPLIDLTLPHDRDRFGLSI